MAVRSVTANFQAERLHILPYLFSLLTGRKQAERIAKHNITIALCVDSLVYGYR